MSKTQIDRAVYLNRKAEVPLPDPSRESIVRAGRLLALCGGWPEWYACVNAMGGLTVVRRWADGSTPWGCAWVRGCGRTDWRAWTDADEGFWSREMDWRKIDAGDLSEVREFVGRSRGLS